MSRQPPRFWILAGMLLCTESFGAPVRVAGTKVSLDPPESFSVAEQFPGFGRPDLLASIVVTEIPGPSLELQKGMTKEGLATKGMTLIESRTQKVGGKDALLLKVSQRAAGTEFLKIIMVAGDQSNTTMVTGTYPRDMAAELEAAIKRSILSVTWESKASTDPFEGLLYRIEPTKKLKLAGRIGNMLMFSESGGTGPLPPKEPRYIVGNSLDSNAVDNIRSFSEARAAATATLKNIRQLNGRELTVDGLKGYELLADAKNDKTGAPMRLYQVVAAAEKGYFIIQGIVPTERAEEWVPEFKKVTASFGRNKQ